MLDADMWIFALISAGVGLAIVVAVLDGLRTVIADRLDRDPPSGRDVRHREGKR